jgi:NADH-quinone oxidoreductase subunit G
LAERKTKPVDWRFAPYVEDFYFTNPVARASAVMAECSQLRIGMREAAE